MQTWEYAVLFRGVRAGKWSNDLYVGGPEPRTLAADLDHALNALGAEGWELVTSNVTYYDPAESGGPQQPRWSFYFKRPRRSE
jgi:hypothetical protein